MAKDYTRERAHQMRAQINIDYDRDERLTPFGKATLDRSYLLAGEKYQDAFARVAGYFGDDAQHAQRVYDRISKHHFMPATPVLSNGGTYRGMPISCFAGNTPIITSNGSKNIEDINVGDMVLTHKGRFRKVVGTRKQLAGDLYEVIVHGRSTKLIVTGNHLLLTNRGWTRVDEIDPASDLIATNREITVDEVEHENGLTYAKAISIAPVDGEIDVFDIEVEEDHSFSAAGVVAHNCFLNDVEDSIEGIVGTWNENVALARHGGGIGCVDADTEFLTPQGWKRIADYAVGDEVFIVNQDGTGHFELPVDYIAAPYTKMYRFDGEFADMVVSDKHRNYIQNDGRAFIIRDTNWLLENNRWQRVRFQPGVRSRGGAGVPYTESELRFMVALAADGSEVRGRPDIKFGLRRHRKIERLERLLIELGVEYRKYVEGVNTVFYLPDVGARKLPLNFENFGAATAEQLAWIFDELGHWDGTFDARTSNLRFSTMRQDEADFVQYVVMAVTGHRAGIGQKASGEWNARETSATTVMVNRMEEFTPADGKQYCFKTSTTLWLARRNGKIFTTGNTYWGDVRSMGESVGANGKTTGVVPFIKVQDSMTLAISQGSLRRGSAAMYLPVWHPEIEEFIDIRRPTGGDPNRKALNLHHGVVITNEFMNAVESGCDFSLRSPKTGMEIRKISARELWSKMLQTRMEQGEPYFLFIDNVNEVIQPYHRDQGLLVKQSNLCVEITLPTGIDRHGNDRTAVCCLSSLNLERWDEYSHEIDQVVEDVLRFLDNVLEDFIKNAPPEFAKAVYSAIRERSVGLGVMGFHSYLQSKGVAFESNDAKAINVQIHAAISDAVDRANEKLALERGACHDAAEAGVMRRFSSATAHAPTASISIIAGTTSPMTEPVLTNVFSQKTLSGTFTVKNRYLERLLIERGLDTKEVWADIIANEGSVQHVDYLTDQEKAIFKTAFEIDQQYVINMAADRQPFIHQSQSVNLFLRPNVNKRKLHHLHMDAWRKGMKSLYYCRSMAVARAEKVNVKVANYEDKAQAIQEANKYEVCEACT